MTATDSAKHMARTAALKAAEKHAVDIVALDVSQHVVITDVFVIVSAKNERQIAAIVDAVEDGLHREHGAKPLRREGVREGHWALLDYAEIVVHIFASDDREFYGLERLWKDCPVIEVPTDVDPAANELS